MMPPRFVKKAGAAFDRTVPALAAGKQVPKHPLQGGPQPKAFPEKLAALMPLEKKESLYTKEPHEGLSRTAGGSPRFHVPEQHFNQLTDDPAPPTALIPAEAGIHPSVWQNPDVSPSRTMAPGFRLDDSIEGNARRLTEKVVLPDQPRVIRHNVDTPPSHATEDDKAPGGPPVAESRIKLDKTVAQAAHHFPLLPLAQQMGEGGRRPDEGSSSQRVQTSDIFVAPSQEPSSAPPATFSHPADGRRGKSGEPLLGNSLRIANGLHINDAGNPVMVLARATYLAPVEARTAAETGTAISPPDTSIPAKGETTLPQDLAVSAPPKESKTPVAPLKIAGHAPRLESSRDDDPAHSDAWMTDTGNDQVKPQEFRNLALRSESTSVISNAASRSDEVAATRRPTRTERTSRDETARPEAGTRPPPLVRDENKMEMRDDLGAFPLPSLREIPVASTSAAALHPPAAQPLPPAEQVSIALSNTGLLPPAAPLAAPAPAKIEAGIVRSLTLQLHPADLGAVTLTVRLQHQGIALRIETDSEQTLILLQRDETVLREVLRGAGYVSDAGTVQIVLKPAADILSPQPPSQQLTSGSHQQPASSSGGQSGSAQPDGRRGQQQSHQFQPGTSQHDSGTLAPGDRPHGGIFI